MKVVAGRAALAASREPSRATAFVIGNFDGVHLGHRALLRAARARAEASGGRVGVLTFDPHPARLFAPALAPPLIVSLRRRIELLGEEGADLVVVEPFTPAFAAIEATSFVRDVLARDLGARDVVVGYDFSFGRGRKGDTRLLGVEGLALGIGVTVVPPVTVSGLTCSSTKVREFALEGRVEGAAMLLGRPLEVTGEVIHGAGRGRTLGIPTANVKPEGELLPSPGIYAGRAVVLPDAEANAHADADANAGSAAPARGRRAPAAGESHPCALSIGTNPTFKGSGALSVEAHLLDFAGDIYGRRVRLEIVHRLRVEQRFESSAALVAQIQADIADTRKVLAG
jgi:riboflavin kinase/FMN adenylyltransferase